MLARRLWQRIRRFFRAIFLPVKPDPLAEFDEAFVPIDIDEVKQELNLVEEAVRFGQKNLPATDDTSPDGPQLRIQQYLEERVAEAFRRANIEFQRLRDALSARALEPLIEKAEKLPDDAARSVLEAAREADRKIRELEEQLAEHRRVVDRYRFQYKLDRAPKLRNPDERRLVAAGAIVIGLCQAIANAYLFSHGMPYGLSAGLMLAFLLGIFDIIVHILLGRQAARIVAPDPLNRVIGAAACVLVLLSIPFWNLAMVHLRIVIRRHGFAEGTENWWTSFTADPFGFTDFASFALLAVGAVCSILAVATGWHWDEPIPVLREETRKIEEISAEVEYWRDRRLSAEADARQDAENRLEQLQEDIAHNVHVAEAILAQIERLTTNLSTFVGSAERAYKALVQCYRDENRLARTTPPPAYFREEPVLRIQHPIEFDLDQMRAEVERRKKLHREFTDRTRELRNRIARAIVGRVESKVEV